MSVTIVKKNQDVPVVVGKLTLPQETVEAIGAKMFYCPSCEAMHVGVNGIDIPEELQDKDPSEFPDTIPADEIENWKKFQEGLRVRGYIK